jgi:hypothetical protein
MAFKPTTLVCNKGSKTIVTLSVEKIKQARKDLGNGHSSVTSSKKSPTSKEHQSKEDVTSSLLKTLLPNVVNNNSKEQTITITSEILSQLVIGTKDLGVVMLKLLSLQNHQRLVLPHMEKRPIQRRSQT